MWEMIPFVMAGFLGGWGVRGLIGHSAIKSRELEEPEMMWFNKKASQWERVTKMHLLVADHVVVDVPVKLVEKLNMKDRGPDER